MDTPTFLNGEGGYCFISHSFYDFKKVREIRNILEEQGFNPLCFFLKCMTDEDEIDGLIRREIEAREIFILADSENSRKSKAVQKEKDIVTRMGRSIYTIDLDNNESPQALAEQIMNRIRVFISYSYRDEAIASRIKTALLRRDLRVFLDRNDLMFGQNIAKTITNAINEAAQYGCVLVLLTKNSLRSEWVSQDLLHAHTLNARIMPVIVEDVELPLLLRTTMAARISENPTDEEINLLCNHVHEILRS